MVKDTSKKAHKSDLEKCAEKLSVSLPRNQLLQTLDTLEKVLFETFQDVSNKDVLSSVCKILSSEEFLQYKNDEVQMKVAYCIADLISIFAPESPFSSEALTGIFDLFLRLLKNLAVKESRKSAAAEALLEKITAVRGFILMLDLPESEEMGNRLFDIAFDCVAKDVRSSVIKLLQENVISVVDNADELSSHQIDSILLPLMEKRPETYKFCAEIVKASYERIQELVGQLYRHEVASEDIKIKSMDRIRDVIVALAAVDSRCLQLVSKSFHEELQQEDDQKRFDVVSMLSRVFLVPECVLINEDSVLFSSFLSRFNDKFSDIRCCMLDFAAHFVPVPWDESLVSRIDKEVLNRLRDVDDHVRAEAVKYVCLRKCTDGPLKFVSEDTFRESLERLRDTSSEVRSKAARGMAAVFHKVFSEEEFAEEYVALDIPAKIIGMYNLHSQEDKQTAAEALATMFFGVCVLTSSSGDGDDSLLSSQHPTRESPWDKDPGETKLVRNVKDSELIDKSKLFVAASLERLDANAEKALQKLLRDKIELANVLFPDSNGDKVKATEEKQKPIDCVKKFFPNARPELVKKLVTPSRGDLASNQLMSMLRQTMDAKCPVSKRYKAFMSLIAQRNEKKSARGVKQDDREAAELALKIGIRGVMFFLFNQEALTTVIEEAVQVKDNEKERLSLLGYIAAHLRFCRNLDVSVVSSVADLLPHGTRDVNPKVIELFTFSAMSSLENKDHDAYEQILDVLCPLALISSTECAKYVVPAIANISSDSRMDNLESLTLTLREKLSLTSPELATVLQSLGKVAQIVNDSEKFDKMAPHVVEFVCDKVVVVPPPDISSNALRYGIKLLVRYLGSCTRNPIISCEPVLSRLLDVVCYTEEDEEDSDRQRDITAIRCAAVRGILGIAKFRVFSSLFTPSRMQVLAGLTRDSNEEFRCEYERKLSKYLIGRKLSLSYLAILCLFSSDAQRTIYNSFKTHLQLCVTDRRKLFQDLRDKDTGTGRALSLSDSQTQDKAAAERVLVLPENCIPYLASFLAHCPDFSASSYLYPCRCVWHLLAALLRGEDNLVFIKQIIEFMKKTVDAREDKDCTKNLQILCEFMLTFLDIQSKRRVFKDNGVFPGNLFLSSQYYRIPDESEERRKRTTKSPAIKVPDLTLISGAPPSEKKEEKRPQSLPASLEPPNKKRNISNTPPDSDNESNNDNNSNNLEDQSPTSMFAVPNDDDDDNEDEEDYEAPKPRKRQPHRSVSSKSKKRPRTR